MTALYLFIAAAGADSTFVLRPAIVRAVAHVDPIVRIRTLEALVFFLLAVIISLFWYMRARKIETLRRQEEEKAENERLLSIAEELKIDILDRLCEQYYIYEGTTSLQPKILKEVRSVIDDLRSDTKTRKGLEDALDARYDGVMSKLRETFPKWKEEDYLLYLYTASGFTATTISTLLEKDKPYIYNHLYRIRTRITELNPPLRDYFLAPIGNPQRIKQ